MKVVILYHPRSEHEGRVIGFAEEYKRFNRGQPELVSLESKEGSHMAEVYGITLYPAVLAIADDGSLHKLWQGESLPLMNELQYYIGRG